MTGSLTYLDFNATTPVSPAVLEAMLPWFSERFWNAASAHIAGMTAADAVAQARAQVAGAIGARASEIVFTSGATEANNLALKGAASSASSSRNRVLVGATEHKAVLDTADWLAGQGYEVDLIPVGASGAVEPEVLLPMLSDRVALVSVMLANNETGAIAPIRELAVAAHEAGALFHTDATQALGRVKIDAREMGIDLASFSAHKAYGPKGVGALFVKHRVQVEAQIHGGGHERGSRSGTLNVPGIVGFGMAASIAGDKLQVESVRQAGLISQLVNGFHDQLQDFEVLGNNRLPNTVNIRFVGADAEAVMANAPDVAISSGSACTSAIPTPSHVLKAMGMSDEGAYECVRISVGNPTSSDDIERAVRSLARSVRRVRELSLMAPA